MRSKKIMQKLLVINADDFGLDVSINRGIIEAFRDGIVTNTSLIVGGRAFEEAVQLAKINQELGIGIHLVLNEERSVLCSDKIKSLIGNDGVSFLDYPVFLKNFTSGKVSLKEVHSEFEAQIEKFIKSGLKPTHLDSHKHVHLIPGIFEICLELARKFGIFKVRIPKTPIINILVSERYVRVLSVCGLSILANFQGYKLRKYKMRAPDNCYGLVESGHLNNQLLTGILRRLPAGINELVCHPGFTTDYLTERYKWNYDWATELSALKSPEIKNLISSLDINRISYNDV